MPGTGSEKSLRWKAFMTVACQPCGIWLLPVSALSTAGINSFWMLAGSNGPTFL